ncbi:MAG: diaminopimelate epimerase [Bacteriovoracaceae bacterium]|nr:diaminopimelate epimerase [Bacteriovoracaceae bacterium]
MSLNNLSELIFEKYDATGNDFILVRIEEMEELHQLSFLVKELCDRHFGVGADGVLFWRPLNNHKNNLKSNYQVEMRIFNSDGQEADMCGNGARAVIDLYMRTLNLKSNHFGAGSISATPVELTTRIGTFPGIFEERKISLEMTLGEEPRELSLDSFPLENLPTQPSRIYFAKVGVPHLFLYFENFANFHEFKIDLPALVFRHHPSFQDGTNVNFVTPRKNENGEILSNEFFMRTFERGVEGETLSCGTGVLSLGAVLRAFQNQHAPATIHTRGGIVQVHANADKIKYSGEVKHVFSGRYLLFKI